MRFCVPFMSAAVTVVLPCRSVNPVVSGRESGAAVHSYVGLAAPP